jgi:hypothetical protein
LDPVHDVGDVDDTADIEVGEEVKYVLIEAIPNEVTRPEIEIKEFVGTSLDEATYNRHFESC